MGNLSVFIILVGFMGMVLARPGLPPQGPVVPSPQYTLLKTGPLPTFSLSKLASGGAAESVPAESTRGGAVLSGCDVDTVTSELIVPEPEMPTAGPTANDTVGLYAASFWVGLGAVSDIAICRGAGDSSSAPLLRTGVDIFWDGTEGVGRSYSAWYQWYPGPATEYAAIDVTAGQRIRLTVTLANSSDEAVGGGGGGSSSSNGIATIENESTGYSASQYLTGQPALCGTPDAAWMVEDFPLADGGGPSVPVALANFSRVVFDGAAAGLVGDSDATYRGVQGASVVDIRLAAQGGELTECELLGDHAVGCQRVVV